MRSDRCFDEIGCANPYGWQLAGADPIPQRHFVKAEKVADLGDAEQAGARA
jgi:hypothetical protein